MILNDEKLLRTPSVSASLAEGREIGRRLVQFLVRHNKRARKPLSPFEAKGGFSSRRKLEGIGVAAPQVGVFKRVCVTLLSGRPLVFVNPRIVQHSQTKIAWTESCLSFPGRKVDTWRFAWVLVQCDNWPAPALFGKERAQEWTLESLLESVCVQHEIGHLHGLLMEDFANRDYQDPTTWS